MVAFGTLGPPAAEGASPGCHVNRGGGIPTYSTVVLRRSHLTGNATGHDGGSIANGGAVDLEDGSTIIGNTGGDRGGGIFRADAYDPVTLSADSPVTGTTPDDCVGTPAC
jgi:hypothetical protein